MKPGSGITSPVTVTVIYDNYVHTDGLTSDWGYSVVIEGLDKSVLFDTGTKPEIFGSNFLKTGLDANSIDLLAYSHEHLDHVGGIAAFSAMKTGIPVIIPHSFSGSVTSSLAKAGYEPLLVRDPANICDNLYTSGEFDFKIAEQCLVLDTREGLVVMTGCAHPGIVRMLRDIKQSFNKDIIAVFGGFHLMDKSKSEMEGIIAEMKSLGVRRCGATHCTGDMQIGMFREAFGENYFELGTGNKIVFN
ncbi:MBL fold metallo-hydrolase [bacterium]|nr:MBL fold metallo-hydrolase [bacterium]